MSKRIEEKLEKYIDQDITESRQVKGKRKRKRMELIIDNLRDQLSNRIDLRDESEEHATSKKLEKEIKALDEAIKTLEKSLK